MSANVPAMKKSVLVKFFVLPTLVLGAVGCGRPATEAECQEILRIAAQLELKGKLGSEQLIESEIKEIEKNMREPMMKKCVGKRITDGALTCIRGAKTADELFGECF